MLDDPRRAAVLEVPASLPLSERQCALADETLEDMTPEDANQTISLHRQLIDGSPAARSAIQTIRRQ